MDNPWSGAWDDSGTQDNKPSITLKATVDEPEQEVDIGTPSWSTALHWPDPADRRENSLATADGDAWVPSIYEDIFQKRTSADVSTEQATALSPNEHSALQAEISAETSLSHSTTVFAEVEFSAEESVFASSESSDVFGGFESGTRLVGVEDGGDDPWVTSESFPDHNGGLESWNKISSSSGEINVEPSTDEWEAAQHKEKIGYALPPEVLASLLRRYEELTRDIWPELDEEEPTPEDNWKAGVQSLDVFADILMDVCPDDMTLPPRIEFSKTATAKSMNEALRLTRNFPLTKLSPMARLLASKGSTVWQDAIRSMKEISADDAPIGWRILEKGDEVPVPATMPAEDMKKAGGGFLSFWSRRPPSDFSNAYRKRSSTGNPNITTTSTPNGSKSTSPGMDHDMQTFPTPDKGTSSPALEVSSVNPTTAMVVESTETLDTSIVMASASSPNSAAPSTSSISPAPPAPSMVSRFLNRFSRAKSNTSPRSSLALSTNDLDYLSDLVPSASHDSDEEDAVNPPFPDTSSITATSSSLPTSLPPLLAPPPKAPAALPSATSNSGLSGSASITGSHDDFDNWVGSKSDKNTSGPPPTTSSSITDPYSHSLPLSPIVATSHQQSSVPSTLLGPPPIIFSSTLRGSECSQLASKFRSASQSSSRTPSPALLPPPPRASASSLIPPLSPQTPPSRSQTPKIHFKSGAPPITVAASHTSLDGRDEFSSFHSPDASQDLQLHYPQSLKSLQTSPSGKSSDSCRNLYSADISVSYDNFDDCTSGQLRTPSPPPVPAKSQHLFPLNVVSARSPSPSPSPIQKKITSNHSRTKSLVEAAAAHPGQWPSFSTIILPPPSGSAQQIQLAEGDLLGDDLLVSGGQHPSPRTLAPSHGMPAFPPPLVPSSQMSHLVQSQSTQHASMSQHLLLDGPTKKSVTPVNGIKKLDTETSSSSAGGLSAQDISFFEGL